MSKKSNTIAGQDFFDMVRLLESTTPSCENSLVIYDFRDLEEFVAREDCCCVCLYNNLTKRFLRIADSNGLPGFFTQAAAYSYIRDALEWKGHILIRVPPALTPSRIAELAEL